MKYIVMECHKGYAVLMDEEARYMKAANLRYTVGQTVTAPVLMEYGAEEERRISFYVTRFAAAAACLAIAVSAGSFYYTRNFKTHSTVLISAKTNIRMDLNIKGEVLHLSGGDATADELLRDYNGKGKDKLTAANEILDMEKSQGLNTEDDVVNIFIKTDADEYNIFKEEFENGITDTKVNVYEFGVPKPHEPAKPEAPKPDGPKHKDDKAPEAPKVHEDKGNIPEAPKPPQEEVKAPETPKPDNGAAPAAPSQPEAPKKPEAHDTPEAPAPEPAKPEIKSGEKAVPKPDDNKAEPPKPAEPAAPAEPANNNHFVLRDNNGIIEITREAVEKIKPLLPAPAPHVQDAVIIEENREALPENEFPSLSSDEAKETPQDKPETPEALSPAPAEEIKPESVREPSPAFRFSIERVMPGDVKKDTPRDALPGTEVSCPNTQPSVSPVSLP
ncbi:MAG: hypothetical protein IKW96_13305 [Ruminococcus sp.]|uniref:anti-sigma-I factor RsgI family protein n=1 Tax=Ruminococcus sp. TaxID=41978 RepID=UPI0025E4FD8C|nr:hypothetical protein [Ruminococcus sp.]MBR5684225.1 hypothetical protein [Ruminococcus sp.]